MSQDQLTTVLIVVAALVVNALTSLAKMEKWPPTFTYFVSFGLSIFGGLVIVWSNGGFHNIGPGWNYVATLSAVVAAAQTVYNGIWNKGIDQALTALVQPPPAAPPQKMVYIPTILNPGSTNVPSATMTVSSAPWTDFATQENHGQPNPGTPPRPNDRPAGRFAQP